MSRRQTRRWSKRGTLIGPLVVAVSIFLGCQESTGVPADAGFMISMQADSATAKGRSVDGSFQCLMTFTVKGTASNARDVAAITGLSVRIAPVRAGSSVITTKSVFAKAELGFDQVNSGENLHTTPVAMSSVAGAFAATVWIDYSVNGSSPTSTPATATACQ